MTRNRAARLKSLELQGYKSFATKTLFEFGGTVTAVVGPNGSGKSNIADAIRWVLGEQSYRSLRGRKTEDMIFAGSQARSRAGMAAATLNFDNSEGWLPIEYSEVSIGRRAHRDGKNEYLLNGQRVRLRDIQDLLGGSGLAQRTYTIIGQGLVDSVLSLRADERSKLFEDAAGIAVHRLRREESLKRLEKTRLNLDRVKDILAEIRPRLRSLERQAELANAHDRVREELNVALEQWYGYHWFALRDSLRAAQQASNETADQRDQLIHDREAAGKSLQGASEQVQELKGTIQTSAAQVEKLDEVRENLARELAVAQERLVWLEEEERSLEAELVALEDTKSGVADRLVAATKEVEAKAETLAQQDQTRGTPSDGGPIFYTAARETTFDPLPEGEEGWDASTAQGAPNTESGRRLEKQAKRARAELAEKHEQIERKARWLASERASLEARMEVASKAALDSDEFARRMQEAAHRGALPGLMGNVSQHLRVKPDFETAVMALLDGFHRGVVFQDSHQVESALDWLKGENPRGKLGLLPQSRPRALPPLQVPGDPDCLGCAADLVEASPGYDSAIRLLLGRTLIVRDRVSAARVLEGLPLDARVVTLAGEVFHPAGHVLVSPNGKSAASPKAMRLRLKEVVKEIDELEAQRATLVERREQLEAAVRAELSSQVVRASQAKATSLQEQLHTLTVRVSKLRGQSERNATEQMDTQERIRVTAQQLEMETTRYRAAASILKELEAALEAADNKRTEIIASEAETREARRAAEDHYTQAQIELARLKQQAIEMERRLLDDFGLVSYAGASHQEALGLVSRLTRVVTLPDHLEQSVDRLRRQLRKMGSVNPAAKREYDEVSERHAFLQDQVDDLKQAEEHLKHVIKQLDDTMASQFLLTFEAVAEVFEAYFVRLFGGGSAKLRTIPIEGSEQPGIEIAVRLPGRRARELAMLSGGERSLTAVALIFALLKLSPTPFCVLDEVDAMLDESNVLRFGGILRELSQETQFLVITHNRQTIQEADELYGISLGRDQASEVISLRLDEAEQQLAA